MYRVVVKALMVEYHKSGPALENGQLGDQSKVTGLCNSGPTKSLLLAKHTWRPGR